MKPLRMLNWEKGTEWRSMVATFEGIHFAIRRIFVYGTPRWQVRMITASHKLHVGLGNYPHRQDAKRIAEMLVHAFCIPTE